MAVSTYTAQLNYYDPTYGWASEGTTCQGTWTGAGGARTGVLYFPGLSALKNKIINSVKITVTTGKTGNGTSVQKTAYFYKSANQCGIKTSLNASHKTGSSIGTIKGVMYDNTASYTITFLSDLITAGNDTFCIYDTTTTNYFKWSKVVLTVNWSEPATQPTLSASSVTMGNAVTISTPAASSSYTHRLRYTFGSASGTIATDVAESASWTPPVSLAAQIPNAVSGSGTIYCDTYSGSTLLGTKSIAIKLTVPSSVVPSAGTLTASVSDDTSGTGLYVKGMGKARVQLTDSAGAQGSTIKSTKITGGGWTENDADMTTGTLTTAGEIVFTATVTDSRGRTASTTCTIEVLNYSKPGITSCNVYRCDETGAKKNDGTCAAVEISAFFSEITGNALTLTAEYKLSTDTDYGSTVDLANGGKTVIGDGDLSSSKTYDIRITIADKYNEITRIYPLSTRKVMRSILKNLGIAFGKVAELSGWMDVAFHLRCRKDLQVDGSISCGNPDTTLGNLGAVKKSGDTMTGVLYVPKLFVKPNAGNDYPTTELQDSNGSRVGSVSTGTASRRMCLTNYPASGSYYEQYRTPALPSSLTANGVYEILTTKIPVTIAQGGTNATEPIAARKNLGLGSTRVYNGSLSSGSATFDCTNYTGIVIVGKPASSAGMVAMYLPVGYISGSTRSLQIADESNFLLFELKASGGTGTITIKTNAGSGNISQVWGVI